MANGHVLMGACRAEWNHDRCPGHIPPPRSARSEPGVYAGTVCHCPCHALRRRLTATEEERDGLTTALIEREGELLAARREITRLRAGLDLTLMSSLRPLTRG